jgi:hypothetical protein
LALSDSQQLKQKRKLIELVTALSGFLGIVVALISTNAEVKALIALFLVILIVASFFAYSKLLSDRTTWRKAWTVGYELDIGLISLSFSILLTLTLASSFAQLLSYSVLGGTTEFVIYTIVVAAFFFMFTYVMRAELSLDEPKAEGI